MTNHRITIIGETARCQARCSCTKKSPVGDRGAVDAWAYLHLEEVQRIRAHLGNRNPSLKSQYEWFVKQAGDPENPQDERELWRQLADEIARHMAKKEPMRQEEVLF